MKTTTDRTSKFKKNKKYKSLCTILSPYGIIEPGIIHTGLEWEEILMYEVGNGFNLMFKLIKEKK